ncbi:MAG: transglutaminase domain-containing protein [Pseudobacteriovorax sp.]|nr:transglutaminase domain-containing protein [Pseudobacteriovorax sp.]
MKIIKDKSSRVEIKLNDPFLVAGLWKKMGFKYEQKAGSLTYFLGQKVGKFPFATKAQPSTFLVNYESTEVKGYLKGLPKFRNSSNVEGYLHKHFKKSYSYGFLRASEVVEANQGDCTEHSVLFSAINRNRGVPTRIIHGIFVDLKTRKAFGHAWNMAYENGKWAVFDAALGAYAKNGFYLPLLYIDREDMGYKRPLTMDTFATLPSEIILYQ